MRLQIALVRLCAVMLMSACTREPAPADDAQVTAATPAQSTSAQSTPAQSTPAEPCEDAIDQRSMAACWANESRAQEQRVAEALSKLEALLAAKSNPAAREQLQEDQRRWQEFVEGHCGLYGELYDGGSAAAMTMAVCRSQLAQSRLQQLSLLSEELDR